MGGLSLSTWARVVSFCLVVPLALAACSGTRQASEVQRLQARAAFERGIKHFNDREATQALAALREAAALDPTSALYRDTLGLIYIQLQRPDLALDQFRRAVKLDPLYADAHFHLGIAFAESTKWAEAVKSYRKALSLPTLTVGDLAHQNLGLALYHLRRYREAEQELQFAISLSPDLQAAYLHLAFVFVAEGRVAEARMAFARARELGPETPFGEAASERLKALGEEPSGR